MTTSVRKRVGGVKSSCAARRSLPRSRVRQSADRSARLQNWLELPDLTMDSSHEIASQPSQLASPDISDVERVGELARAKREVLEQLRLRIVGQETAVELLLVALFARGHGLLVGVPGLAKTSLVSSLAEA